ncbi:MAG: imelysin family protein [Planctomycetota bacterium]
MSSRSAWTRTARFVATICILAVSLTYISCSSGGGDNGGGGESTFVVQRRESLVSLANNVIIPLFQTLIGDCEDLVTAAQALHDGADASTLAAAQEAWRGARDAWNPCEVFIIGEPLEDLLLARIDTAPINPAFVELEVSGTDTIDEAYVETMGSTRTGFHAIEYLLFDAENGDAAVLESLTTGENASRRLDYVLAVSENLVTLARRILAAWTDEGGLEADFESGITGIEKSRIDDLVNRALEFLELVADQRLGRPLGRTSFGLPQEPGAESDESGYSRTDILGDLHGIELMYLGDADDATVDGLSELVQTTSIEIDDEFRELLQESIDLTEAIPETLADSGESSTATVEAAFLKIRELKRLVALDLAVALSVTLRFSGFDGD